MGNFPGKLPSGQFESLAKRRIFDVIEKSLPSLITSSDSEEDEDEDTKRLPLNQRTLTEIDQIALNVNLSEYEFQFENLVFEGGGVKGLAYCGCLKALEEFGIVRQIRKYAGASVGAITAALLAVGYTSQEMEVIMGQDLWHLFMDARFGYLSLLPNLIGGYGWNPGTRAYHWLGELMAQKTGNPDITFSQLYKTTQKELCIIVTNLNHVSEEYCHPKTTPDMPIRLAVRMSMGIPGMFQATHYKFQSETNTYVDGGVVCNYPIHCFDGWWLSMKSGDSFLEKLHPLEDLPSLLGKKNRFGQFNEKTIGFILYSDAEQDLFRHTLDQRIGSELTGDVIDSDLYRQKQDKRKQQEKARREHERVTKAADAFLKVLRKHNLDKNHVINREELKNALIDPEFTPHRSVLLGDSVSVDEVMDVLDVNGDGNIQYHEMVHFLETKGVLLQQRYLGYHRKDIWGLLSFWDALQYTLLTNLKRAFVNIDDMQRTVGINTGHVDTTDFKMEQADKDFLIEQGRRSTVSFLKYYVANNPTKVKRKSTSVSAEDNSATKPIINEDQSN